MSEQASRMPGPWVAQRIGDDNWGVYGHAGTFVIAVGLTDDEARLMAAAPDLLASCTAMLALIEREWWDAPDFPEVQAMRAAVATATGDERS